MGRTYSKASTRRCGARHPMYGKQVECEEVNGHQSEHFNSSYLRSWPNPSRAPRFSDARVVGLFG